MYRSFIHRQLAFHFSKPARTSAKFASAEGIAAHSISASPLWPRLFSGYEFQKASNPCAHTLPLSVSWLVRQALACKLVPCMYVDGSLIGRLKDGSGSIWLPRNALLAIPEAVFCASGEVAIGEVAVGKVRRYTVGRLGVAGDWMAMCSDSRRYFRQRLTSLSEREVLEQIVATLGQALQPSMPAWLARTTATNFSFGGT
jgi:hypothetical protein